MGTTRRTADLYQRLSKSMWKKSDQMKRLFVALFQTRRSSLDDLELGTRTREYLAFTARDYSS